ncbi:5,6-dimethylbenzimidazole phosphoribosyltransferase [Psychromonas sp. CNPT3]|uniref:Sir2 family NAD+-dependent deacetylase n=1 Tax=Psychromonas sp. CNPT3 TaxID=314282 RepID=UPI0002C0935F|nr:Sir2 family NAD+-dependent deacetylase [Psychromonas sp. CNPT3]AGH80818.1 5,6-dimethylbenzimidazole phosphoribosyltransferase [Psychromonas sp. CNPT3]
MKNYKKIVVLTGAGISAESGVRTFRAQDGLWEDHRVEDVATLEGYLKNPQFVLNFYNNIRQKYCLENIKANTAHQALAKLEQEFSGDFLLITQNIDNLHEQAGSKNIIHMHGELLKARCTHCMQVFDWDKEMHVHDICQNCQTKGSMRPNIVWFGEIPFEMDTIYDALFEADLFIAIGTSGHVYPAAGFAEEAKQAGAYSIELNVTASQQQSNFDKIILEKASISVPLLVDAIVAK